MGAAVLGRPHALPRSHCRQILARALRERDLAAGARFLAGALVPDVADPPDDTRVECLARGRTGFLGGAASATDTAAKATSNAATRTLRLRIMALR